MAAAYWAMSKDWLNEKVGSNVLGAKPSAGDFINAGATVLWSAFISKRAWRQSSTCDLMNAVAIVLWSGIITNVHLMLLTAPTMVRITCHAGVRCLH